MVKGPESSDLRERDQSSKVHWVLNIDPIARQ